MSDTQAETSKQDEQITHPQPVDTQQQLNSKIQPQDRKVFILVPRGRAPFGQHQESRPWAWFNNGSPRFTDFPPLCACSESSLTNLIDSGLNLMCHSKTECRWTGPEEENGRFSKQSVISFLRSSLGQKNSKSTLLGNTLCEKRGEYAN